MLRQQAPFEQRSLRHALGAFVTGVTVITTCDATGKAYGLTATSFTTVSVLAGVRFVTADDKFEGIPVDERFCGLPVIVGSSAWLHCRAVSQFDGGDHTVYIGEILKFARGDRPPLVFGGGRYLFARPFDEAPQAESSG